MLRIFIGRLAQKRKFYTTSAQNSPPELYHDSLVSNGKVRLKNNYIMYYLSLDHS